MFTEQFSPDSHLIRGEIRGQKCKNVEKHRYKKILLQNCRRKLSKNMLDNTVTCDTIEISQVIILLAAGARRCLFFESRTKMQMSVQARIPHKEFKAAVLK